MAGRSAKGKKNTSAVIDIRNENGHIASVANKLPEEAKKISIDMFQVLTLSNWSKKNVSFLALSRAFLGASFPVKG